MMITRFAPSPNGHLHMGHAFSAIIAHDLAIKAGGQFALRIEDIDGVRSKPELAEEFREDLKWLGLEFEEVAPQSGRLENYEAAATKLRELGVLYPCICSRTDIRSADPKYGPMGAIYAGTCRAQEVDPDLPVAWRLDAAKALAITGPLSWHDTAAGILPVDMTQLGDVVIWRKEEPASYHLAATLDDAADGVTLVTRGFDLFHATHVHRILQALMDLPVPQYHHHPLLLDEGGEKLAKRRGSASLADLREAGEDGLLLAEQLRLHSFPAGISLQKA
ncbi:MAG: tRNA glutamyl-Q(34) synthetase GluQRS [Erythrobacter sp.]